MNTKLTLSILAFVGGLLIAASAQASFTWDIVGTAPGEPDLFGQITTPDIPVNCPAFPPHCSVSGTLTIPAGALGGTGTRIDLAVDAGVAVISIATNPPAPGDEFFVFGISKDGYTCNPSSSFVLQCDFDSTTAFYDLVLTEQVPKVVIGNGNALITGQLEVAGHIIEPAAPTVYSIGDEGPGGGIVFYVRDGGLRGLEAAPHDHGSHPWCPVPNHETDIFGIYNIEHRYIADGNTGAFNTPRIKARCVVVGDNSSAAMVAAAYVWPNGQTDGFLPNKEDLHLMHWNLHVNGLGSFSGNGVYWSSTEADQSQAWVQQFTLLGSQHFGIKSNANIVRAVRAF